jgi:manganese oxidase
MSSRIAQRLLLTVVLSGCAAGAGSTNGGQVRTYYVAADEVPWDYAPGGTNGLTGDSLKTIGYFKNGPKPVSTSYVKALYREYTDSTFKTLKPIKPEWEHLGFLGPMIRGVVGDTIKVYFRNNAHQPYSMHPHGVFYDKNSEGASYADGTSGADKIDDGVPSGTTHLYVWPVPERAGPAMNDLSSVIWMYHSHHDEVKDVNSGLMGPMEITARGKAKADGSPADVDREFVTAFMQVHEEDSWLAMQNIGKNFETVTPPPPGLTQNFYPYFVKFAINGFTYGTAPLNMFTMKKGERVRWYVFASTNDFDAHAPHWHGNTLVINHMRMDVASLNPMEMLVGDMVPDNPGTWLFHCHISFHFTEGMGLRSVVN